MLFKALYTHVHTIDGENALIRSRSWASTLQCYGVMQPTALRNLIYLNSSQSEGLPVILQGVSGVCWHFAKSTEELKKLVRIQRGELFVIVHTQNLSVSLAEAFHKWGQMNLKMSFIFIAKTIDKAVHQLALNNEKMLFLFESEGERIADLVTRRLMGLAVKSRKQERHSVQSQVMLKKSAIAEESPTGGCVQFLREGCMRDFSKGGAQIQVGQAQVRVKDFVSLMYQNRHGKWVSVESQVRWVVSTLTGDQIIGVQFLAVSA